MVSGLRCCGWSIEVRELDPAFPRPTAEALHHADRVFCEIANGATIIVDGLALGALPAQAERHAARLRIVALVHHPLAAETGVTPEVAAELEASERRALASARAVVVTSQATAAAIIGYGVEPDRLVVVRPGTDAAPKARGSQGARLHMLCVATLIPRKGHDVLVRALEALRDRNWHLTCAGSLDRHPPTVARIRRLLGERDLDGRVVLAGELDAAGVSDQYDRADLFVLPTRYEGYGMAVAEAIARGLPVVASATGAIPELLADGGGLLVPPGDPAALANALSRMIDDPDARARFAAAASCTRDRLPSWASSVGRMADCLTAVGRG
jgi:glycosyltransferase involved in cell wall biosynthesis